MTATNTRTPENSAPQARESRGRPVNASEQPSREEELEHVVILGYN